MTLEEAVKILNARRHRGNTDWYIYDPGNGQPRQFATFDRSDWLDEFEGAAIAAAYSRQTGTAPIPGSSMANASQFSTNSSNKIALWGWNDTAAGTIPVIQTYQIVFGLGYKAERMIPTCRSAFEIAWWPCGSPNV